MKIQPIAAGSYGTNTYIVQNGRECIIIDAPFPSDRTIAYLQAQSLTPQALLLTHAHFDHIFGLPALRSAFPEMSVYVSADDMYLLEDNAQHSREMAAALDPYTAAEIANAGPMPDDILQYSDGCCGFTIIKTPGHTPGSVCIYSESEEVLFSGDTLFRYGIGRTDLGGSSDEIIRSLSTILKLPGSTLVLPGHGPTTRIGDERRSNPFL